MSAIFCKDEGQTQTAQKSLEERQKQLSDPIVTQILKFDVFYLAEDYHQKYFLRKHRSLLTQLNLTDSEVVVSPIATRINAFCAGFGSIQQLEEEINKFGLTLSEDNKNLIKELIRGGPNLGEC